MVRAVTQAKEKANPKTTFLCLSNANYVFITTILKAGLAQTCVLRDAILTGRFE